MVATRNVVAAAFTLTTCLCSCAVPTTQLGTVSIGDIRAEQLKQQELALQWDLRQQQRIDDVGHALLTAAVPLCNGALVPRAGVRLSNVSSFARDYQPAARALGFSDTLVITGVAHGSAADHAGFAVGDRVVSIDGGAPPTGPNAIQSLFRALDVRRVPAPSLTLRHGGAAFLTDGVDPSPTTTAADTLPADRRLAVPTDTICGYNLTAIRDDKLNAWADGTNVNVTSAMMRFVADDDELATVLAHEIAHNAMRHIQAKQKNTALGGLFGAILDIAAATQGVNTQGEFTKQGMEAGAVVFSQDFEREADYVGMYLLARAGRPTAKAPNLWRRMAQEHPGSIQFATTHPTTAERFVRLEQVAREIEQKVARGDDLRPEMRGSAEPGRANSTRALAATPRPAPAAKAPTTQPPATPTTTVAAQSKPAAAKPTSVESEGAVASPPDATPQSYTTLSKLSKKDSATYTFGPAAPRNGLSPSQAKRRAARAFQDGSESLEVRLYDQAEAKFREAVLYDGGEARYHAALGELLLKRGKLAAAEAALSAAVLLDMENERYRQLLTEARTRP